MRFQVGGRKGILFFFQRVRVHMGIPVKGRSYWDNGRLPMLHTGFVGKWAG